MNPVDLNNAFYSQGYARVIIEHISQIPRNKCCAHEYCCYTCFLIKTYYSVGTLESIITLVESAYYDWYLWWDRENRKFDITWLEARWRCRDQEVILAEAS